MKHKRVWTDEQRQAAAERARARFTKNPTDAATTAVEELPEEKKIRAPEVQAVIDTMDPARKAKLAGIQARQMATLAQTKEGREALERLEARHQPVEQFEVTDKNVPVVVQEFTSGMPEPPKPIVREVPFKTPFRLTGSTSGLMVSELGNCVCGELKLKWHPICLKVRV